MKKERIEPTLLQKAISSIDGFEQVYQKLQQQVTLRGQSQSTLNNYIRCIANISLHFGRLPENICDDEINEYLTTLALNPKSPSRSNFKHAVYGLRYYYRLLGDNKRAIALPSLKKEVKLPVILNRSELRELFAKPALLKHRIVLSLIYSAGLRSQEALSTLNYPTLISNEKLSTSVKASTRKTALCLWQIIWPSGFGNILLPKTPTYGFSTERNPMADTASVDWHG